ncbi:MAG: YgiQ family radical SAM protein, partial [Clostridia bacterium]|nr:YgiQ family radical SAM protein [Clostridia bacterium]
MNSNFLPVTKQEIDLLGWDAPDFVFVTGDAYVDHPSFACAILSRVLESKGFKVAILPQPHVDSAEDFK